MSGRSRSIDGLRGIAALSVLIYHAILHYKPLIPNVLHQPIGDLSGLRGIATKVVLSLVNGESAVILFFAISGFVLTKSLHRDDRIAGFIIRRLLRLYPALFAVMAAMYLLSLVSAVNGWGILNPDIWAVIQNATLYGITWHGPSATIQAELFALPFIMAVFFLSRRLGKPMTLAAFAWAIFAMGTPALVLWAPNMHIWMLAFAIGIVAAENDEFFQNTTSIAIGLMCILFLSLRAFGPNSSGAAVIGQAALSAAIVGSCYHSKGKIAAALSSAPFQFLGRISYSLYLFHIPALMIVWYLIPEDRYAARPLETGLLVAGMATAIVIPVSWLVERYVEQPAIGLGNRLTRGTAG